MQNNGCFSSLQENSEDVLYMMYYIGLHANGCFISLLPFNQFSSNNNSYFIRSLLGVFIV